MNFFLVLSLTSAFFSSSADYSGPSTNYKLNVLLYWPAIPACIVCSSNLLTSIFFTSLSNFLIAYEFIELLLCELLNVLSLVGFRLRIPLIYLLDDIVMLPGFPAPWLYIVVAISELESEIWTNCFFKPGEVVFDAPRLIVDFLFIFKFIFYISIWFI